MYIISIMNKMEVGQTSLVAATMSWVSSLPTLSEHARSAYFGEANRLREHLESHGIVSINQMGERHWLAYLEALMDGRPTVSSRRLGSLKSSSALQAARITRSFLRHCWLQGWLGWIPSVGSCRPQAASTARQTKLLPAEVLGEVLLESTDEDASLARVRCAAALAFWGGLKPLEIASLRHQHLHRLAGRLDLHVPGRRRPVLVANLLAQQIDRYDHLRRRDLGAPGRDSALVSQLGSYLPLTGSSVWALLRTWPSADGSEVALGAKKLRDSFAALASQDARLQACATKAQTGLNWPPLASADFDEDLPAAATGMLANSVLVRLQSLNG